jgi:hypothetical protein
MQDYQIIALSKIFAGYVRALGMQAENKKFELEGRTLPYTDKDFEVEASNIEYAGGQLR